MIQRLYEKEWSHDVLMDDATGTYYIEVLCGGSAMYTLRVRLTEEEIARFRQSPSALDTLAAQIAQRPSSVADRTVRA